ncbi:MAG: PEP-CTERM sorting domain-containing protein [Leptolyngbya sp. SIOISBB]|nr:PEP-CTERM sorting domain-containing protein [Leptolyngbya sp. SIOISBB]
MTAHAIIRSLKKVSCITPILAASAIGLGAIAPEAQATSLVPQQEGEVNVGLGTCLGSGCSYLTLDSIIQSVESLEDSSTGTKSRLFVDQAGTDNTYGGIQFLSTDIGTSDGSGDFWFRPVAMDQHGTTPLVENGQLEVGTFEFTFSQVLGDLTVNWFDTERSGGTSYTAFDAQGDTIATGTIAAGSNGNVQETTLTNVKSIILNLGERKGRTGDGVNFQLDSTVAVPEPGLMMGLGAFALAGGFGLRKRQGDRPTA